MSKISIKITNNTSIVKFELEDFITRNQNFEFKNIDETENSFTFLEISLPLKNFQLWNGKMYKMM
jgi:hypothetical protein